MVVRDSVIETSLLFTEDSAMKLGTSQMSWSSSALGVGLSVRTGLGGATIGDTTGLVGW